MSAYGLALADVVEEAQEPVACIYGSDTYPELKARLDALASKARQSLKVDWSWFLTLLKLIFEKFSKGLSIVKLGWYRPARRGKAQSTWVALLALVLASCLTFFSFQYLAYFHISSPYIALLKRLVALRNPQARGFGEASITTELFLHMRYERTDCALMISGGSKGVGFEKNFEAQYMREFGFTIPGRPLVVDDVRVRATGRGITTSEKNVCVVAWSTTLALIITCSGPFGFVSPLAACTIAAFTKWLA